MGRQTCLYARHLEAGAKMINFSGWDMPLHYGSQLEEHRQVREHCGVFDVSHMGLLEVSGEEATDFLRHVLSNDVARLKTAGRAQYSLLLSETGGVLDDLIVYRLEDRYWLVVNCARQAADLAWLQDHSGKWQVEISTLTGYAILAVHGPQAIERVSGALDRAGTSLSTLEPFSFFWQDDWLIARTGYTGEHGLELIVPEAQVDAFWCRLREAGVPAIGLGARDTLRLEAGMNLYGQDMDEQSSPWSANLGAALALSPASRHFIGRAAVEVDWRRWQQGELPQLVGVVLEEQGVLRAGQAVRTDLGEGVLTSGCFSPSLRQGIGLARVPVGSSRCQVELRGKFVPARLVRPGVVRLGQPVPLKAPTYPVPLTAAWGFVDRHIGPDAQAQSQMLSQLGYSDMDALMADVVPEAIRHRGPLQMPEALGEEEALSRLAACLQEDKPGRALIGLGYYDTLMPAVIQRNVLENPGWYTAYTPYQAEISQGRLECLLAYQQMIMDLCALPLANASLLDEATAAAEGMMLAYRMQKGEGDHAFFVDARAFPQTIDVLRTRADALEIPLIIDELDKLPADGLFGALLQYPASDGEVRDLSPWIERLHEQSALAVVAADLMSLVMLRAPGDMGADVVVGSSQRFGVPMGYGGPHAAFFATREEYRRAIPGRLIGVSRDRRGRVACRMALQTREQHIRREKANSNICTAQVLLANIAALYAMYHGAQGLRAIAGRIHGLSRLLATGLAQHGLLPRYDHFFDTLTVEVTPEQGQAILQRARQAGLHLRQDTADATVLGLSLDECSTEEEVQQLWSVLLGDASFDMARIREELEAQPSPVCLPRHGILRHDCFQRYRSETGMLRYLKHLEEKDISLTRAMIPLGSCTMKLNATTEMQPLSWPALYRVHPFIPREMVPGYQQMLAELQAMLAEITGFDAVSLQPNSGAQGEYAGLLTIRRYLDSQGQQARRVCLVPTSAHGTNPASARLAGLQVVSVACDAQGNVDVEDLRAKVEAHAGELAALMLTYPSTHGVFEPEVRTLCDLVHAAGGLVYMDGANLNALVGLARPADIGADVCHVNLHKTFCIPHGGGGPGMGPIGVTAQLAPWLPGHPLLDAASEESKGAVSAAPWGSAAILAISWMYLRLMGPEGLSQATQVAILNANYMALRLSEAYPVRFTGPNGRVAHECIIDLRPLKESAGITEADVAKRLMDFGFHAPTMSFPVPGTLMIEPTESENLAEMERFIEAMLCIREEIAAIERGELSREDNPLVNAPHTLSDLLEASWSHPYSRQQAVTPLDWVADHKYWPPVNRVDEVYGDRHLHCGCPPASTPFTTLGGKPA